MLLASAARTAAAAAASAVPAARTTLEPELLLLGPGETSLQRGMAGALIPHADVIHLLGALDLAPAVGEEVAVAPRRALAQLVGVGDLQVEALDADLSVVGHAEKGTSGAFP